MPEIVFDTCVLSNFALSDDLHLIGGLYRGRAMITDFVGAEITRGIHQGHQRLAVIKAAVRDGIIREISLSTGEEKALFEEFSVSLGCGEASSIAAAKTRGLTFASDDRVARREADRLGIRLTGTLGILKRAHSRKLVTVRAADDILKRMMDSGFFSPVSSIKEI